MKRVGTFLIVIFLLAVSLSCQKRGTAQIEEGEELGAVSINSKEMENSGLVVYLTGSVLAKNESGSRELNIGDIVNQDDTVVTETESYCEIQIGDAAMIRIDEKTVLGMESLSTANDKTDVRLDLASGSVLCKVEKLLKSDDSFKVKTDGAVCGVRGTRFSVSRKENGETVFAVKEGKVAVIPPVVDEIQTLAAGDENVAESVAELDTAAVYVEAQEQLSIQETTFAAVDETLAPVSESASRMISGEEKDNTVLVSAMAKASDKINSEMATAKESKQILSAESARQLEQSDSMQIMEIPASAKSDETTVRKLMKVALKAVPATAVIEVDGQFAGKGEFSHVYPEGTVINLIIAEPGYETYSFSMTIEEKKARVHTIKLTKAKAAVQPVDNKSGDKPAAVADGTETQVNTNADKPILVSFKVSPDDAEILVNKEIKGKGTWSGEYKNGEILEITVNRNGYESKSMNLTVGSGVAENIIQLDAKPLEARYPVSKEAGIGSLITDGDMVYYADAAGTLYAVSTTEGVKWTRSTTNKPNENSQPVVDGSNIFFSGVKELVITDKNTGKVKASIPLSGDMVHLFGSRVQPVKDLLVFPANNSLFLIGKNTGEIQSEILLPGGTRMTPGLWKSKVLIVNQKGSLLIVDLQSGSIDTEIQTQAMQPVAIAVSVYKDFAVFCGRKGTVSAVNMAKNSVMWEKDLSGTIYNDIAVGPKGSYVYMDGTLTALDWKSGANLFKPISGISCPPLVNGNLLIYVTDGKVLTLADADSGKIIKRMQLEASVSTRPAMAGDKIIVLSGSEILVINPEGITK